MYGGTVYHFPCTLRFFRETMRETRVTYVTLVTRVTLVFRENDTVFCQQGKTCAWKAQLTHDADYPGNLS
jgi:hypothetical protein